MKKLLLTLLTIICIACFSFTALVGCDGFGGDVDLGGGNNQDDTGSNDQGGDDNQGDNQEENNQQAPQSVTQDGVNYTLTDNVYVVTSVTLASNQTEVTVQGELHGKSVTKIGEGAFMGKTTITKVTLPESVTQIGPSAFRRCKGLVEINLEKVKTVGEYSFSECSVLALANLQKLDEMGQRAFEKCVKLKTVTFNGNLNQISLGAFSGCNILKTVTLTDQIVSVSEKAFNGCAVLSEIDLSKIEYIGNGAFTGCNKLADIRLDSIKTIDVEAFSGCLGLKTVYLGPSCEMFYRMAFASCSALTGITVADKTGWRVFFYNSRTGIDIYEYGNYNVEQKFATPESAKEDIVPDAWGSGNNYFYAKNSWLIDNMPQFAK